MGKIPKIFVCAARLPEKLKITSFMMEFSMELEKISTKNNKKNCLRRKEKQNFDTQHTYAWTSMNWILARPKADFVFYGLFGAIRIGSNQNKIT